MPGRARKPNEVPPHVHGSDPKWSKRYGCPHPLCVAVATDVKRTRRAQLLAARRCLSCDVAYGNGWVKHRPGCTMRSHPIWYHPALSSEPVGVGEGPWHGTVNGYNEYGCRCETPPRAEMLEITRPGCGPVGRAAAQRRRAHH